MRSPAKGVGVTASQVRILPVPPDLVQRGCSMCPSNHEFNDLIGARVNAISVGHGEEYLIFHTDRGMIGYVVSGDCCSESWFADISGIQNMIGNTVDSATWVDLPYYNVMDGRTRQDDDSAYGFEIRTDGGVTSFVFRNSSNGYYGGEMSRCHNLPDDQKFFVLLFVNEWSA